MLLGTGETLRSWMSKQNVVEVITDHEAMSGFPLASAKQPYGPGHVQQDFCYHKKSGTQCTSPLCTMAVKPSKKGFLFPEVFMMSGVRLRLMQCPLLPAV